MLGRSCSGEDLDPIKLGLWDYCWCAIFANNYWIVWRIQGTLDLWPKLKGPLTNSSSRFIKVIVVPPAKEKKNRLLRSSRESQWHHLESRVKKSDISSSKLNYPNIGFWIFWSHDPSHQVHHISPSKLIYSSTEFLSHSIHRVIEFSIRPFLNFSHIYSSQRRLVMYWALICSSIGFIHQTHHNSPYLIKLTIKSFAPPESGSHGNGK